MAGPGGGGTRVRATSLRAAFLDGCIANHRPDGRSGQSSPNRATRYALVAAIAILTLGIGAYLALQIAIDQLGPPPVQAAGAHIPTSSSQPDPASRDVRYTSSPAQPLDPQDVDQLYLAMLFTFEDRRFYSHFGVDPVGIARAARDLLANGRIITGGSTITMQVARLIDNKYQRTPSVKLLQILRAIQLERDLTKKQILSLYLALAPFGGRTKGVRAASHQYFGKDPRQLTLAEAALLVALPQAPEARRLDRHPEAARRARNFVLDTVAAAGVLTTAQAELAKREPLTPESTMMPPIPVPKPSTQVAGLFAGLTLGINLVAPPAVAAPIEPAPPLFVGSNEQLVLDVRRKLLKPQPSGTHQDDRDALWMFYAARNEPVWVSKKGWTQRARVVIDEIKRADDWALNAEDFDIPTLPDADAVTAPPTEQTLVAAETALSLAALKYARDARGGRIEDPSKQLSSYIDRKPQVRPPFLVITELSTSHAPDAILRKLHPQNEQFAKLRELYLAQRNGIKTTQVEIPSGNKLRPGAVDPDIALVRERLRVPGSYDATTYDDRLVDAVKRFQVKRGIEPANGVITAKTRRAMNESQTVSLDTLRANMEQWRWMPEDLGEAYVWVSIPEFTVNVVKDGQQVHSERVITGELDTQTPIFSEDLQTIFFHPRWIVPQSIKMNEIGPAIARGKRRDMVVMRNGKIVKPSTVNWYKADIRNYDVYQPSGPGNALGKVKFTFPNKHAVYLHDTPNKGLFGSTQRTFSHGCVRVRNPQRLAEVLLGIDKGWTPEEVDKLLDVKKPEENAVPLDKHIPVHMTYFTARVDDDGDVVTSKDVYGHEKRITQALQGKWDSIDKGADHLAQVELAKRLDDSSKNTRRKTARRSGEGRRYATRSSGGNRYSGGGATRISSSGSSANDVFRRSFGN
jgi:murein L,D-transpeptidase YcbB/YkuD